MADLHEAYLGRADLRGADLRKANMSGAELRGADLREADLSGVDVRGAWYDATTGWPEAFDPKVAGAVLEESGAEWHEYE
jgi:uncharacterized protein YjbI with pentapeptide repeats